MSIEQDKLSKNFQSPVLSNNSMILSNNSQMLSSGVEGRQVSKALVLNSD